MSTKFQATILYTVWTGTGSGTGAGTGTGTGTGSETGSGSGSLMHGKFEIEQKFTHKNFENSDSDSDNWQTSIEFRVMQSLNLEEKRIKKIFIYSLNHWRNIFVQFFLFFFFGCWGIQFSIRNKYELHSISKSGNLEFFLSSFHWFLTLFYLLPVTRKRSKRDGREKERDKQNWYQ